MQGEGYLSDEHKTLRIVIRSEARDLLHHGNEGGPYRLLYRSGGLFVKPTSSRGQCPKLP